MSVGLKTIGVLGTGAVLALGLSTSETANSVTATPAPVIIPKTEESKPVVKPKDVTTIPDGPAKKPDVANIVTETKATSNCHPSYSGCLKMNAGDYDCASGSGNGPNYTGAVQVYGSDPFDLDRDNDGWGCKN